MCTEGSKSLYGTTSGLGIVLVHLKNRKIVKINTAYNTVVTHLGITSRTSEGVVNVA